MSAFPFWNGLLPVAYGALRTRNNYEDCSNPAGFTALTTALTVFKAYMNETSPSTAPPKGLPLRPGTQLLTFGFVVAGALIVNITGQCIGDQLASANQPKNRELR